MSDGTQYVVTAPVLRQFRREIVNGKLRVLAGPRYRRGDVVTLDEDAAQRYLGLGAVKSVDDDEYTVSDDETETADPDNPGDDDTSSEGDGEDQYDNMEYSDLQDLAKERDLPYNSVSKANIIASLREFDSEQ